MAQDALVIVDVQNAILEIPGLQRRVETHAAFDALVAKIATLLERAHKRKIPVLFIQHAGPSGHRLEQVLPGWQIRQERSMAPTVISYIQGSPGRVEEAHGKAPASHWLNLKDPG